MNDPLHGPKLKVKRAYEHIKEIDRQIDLFLADDDHRMRIEVDPETGDRLVVLRFRKPIPDIIHLLVDETIHHLRSALDLLTVALARANGAQNVNSVYFPFAGDKTEFDAARTQRKIQALAPNVADMIRDLRPYKGGNDLLWGLGRMANTNKHVDLISMGSSASIRVFRNFKVTGGKVGFIVPPNSFRMDTGVVLSNLGATGTFEASQDKNDRQISANITFGDVDIVQGRQVVDTLNEMAQLADGIVQRFEPFGIAK